MENNGWIKLHRSIMDHPDWLAEPFTRAQAWVDLLLLANHKTGHIRKRGILIEVQRGQVGYSEESLAARWKWSRDKARRFLTRLKALNQITRKPAQQNPNLSSLISIVNYEAYQSSETTNKTTEKQQTIQEQECKECEEEPPPAISSKISELVKRYSDQEIINQAFQAISSTRKTNRISDTVKLSILKSWEQYPVESVMAGIRAYLDKGYHDQGKGEKYLFGIIRNLKPEASISGPVMKSTGSHALDDHYRGEGIRII